MQIWSCYLFSSSRLAVFMHSTWYTKSLIISLPTYHYVLIIQHTPHTPYGFYNTPLLRLIFYNDHLSCPQNSSQFVFSQKRILIVRKYYKSFWSGKKTTTTTVNALSSIPSQVISNFHCLWDLICRKLLVMQMFFVHTYGL